VEEFIGAVHRRRLSLITPGLIASEIDVPMVANRLDEIFSAETSDDRAKQDALQKIESLKALPWWS
jgi:hypothetical protein